MDVKMPRRDGIDAARRLPKRIAPIVVLTAFSQRATSSSGPDAGAMAYLVKPFSISDLIPAIEVAVTRFSEISALERRSPLGGLETRKLVERAKGLLQAKQGMSEPEAFQVDQRAAMDRRTTMKRVAEVVLETLDPAAEGAPPTRHGQPVGADGRVPLRFPSRRSVLIDRADRCLCPACRSTRRHASPTPRDYVAGWLCSFPKRWGADQARPGTFVNTTWRWMVRGRTMRMRWFSVRQPCWRSASPAASSSRSPAAAAVDRGGQRPQDRRTDSDRPERRRGQTPAGSTPSTPPATARPPARRCRWRWPAP